MKLNNITTPKIMAMVARTERMLSMVVFAIQATTGLSGEQASKMS
nr:hypothetical protein [Akkermansia muciniphila]